MGKTWGMTEIWLELSEVMSLDAYTASALEAAKTRFILSNNFTS